MPPIIQKSLNQASIRVAGNEEARGVNRVRLTAPYNSTSKTNVRNEANDLPPSFPRKRESSSAHSAVSVIPTAPPCHSERSRGI